MKILLTGATGLVGKELGKLLVEQGHDLVVLTRDPLKSLGILPFPARLFPWTGNFPEESLEGVEAVVHLAGEPVAGARWTKQVKNRIRNSRVESTNQIYSAAEALKKKGKLSLKHFIGASAIGFYGDGGDTFLDERSPAGSDFLAGVCKDWEGSVDRFSELSVRTVKIRTGIVLSSQGGALQKLLPVFSLGLGGPIGSGRQWMSWIHIEDIVGLFAHSLLNPSVRGVVNGVAPNPVSNSDFTKSLAESIAVRAPFPVPHFALSLILGEGAAVVTASQRVRSLDYFGYVFRYPKLDVALQSLLEPFRGGDSVFFAEQWIPLKPFEVFPFFSDEKNLEELTPPLLRFKVLEKTTPTVQKGTLIDYRLLIHGVPARWRTLIESWIPDKSFVDTQIKGPYKKWYHIHEFIPFAGGTLLRDTVFYRLPMGWLGLLVAGQFVGRDVQNIFAFRRKVIAEKFSKAEKP